MADAIKQGMLARKVGTLAALLAAVWCVGVPATAQAPALALLDSLTKGQWEVRYRGSEPVKSICVRTGRELIQLRHDGTTCKRFVVEDSAAQVTVQYTCPGNGYGRTNIRRETSTLVQIEGNGTSNAGPFQFMAEARRTGSCAR